MSLSLADLTERERASVTGALVASLARRALDAGESALLCEGQASLGDVLARGLVARVTAPAGPRRNSFVFVDAIRTPLDSGTIANRSVPSPATV